MGIGVAVFLIALGAILTFALETEVSGIDLDTVGIILMIVGALGLAVTLIVFGSGRRRTVVTEQIVDDPIQRTTRRDTF
jgi:hypothetical protein